MPRRRSRRRGRRRRRRERLNRVAIIGAGLAGLTLAHRLTAAGREVTLFEAGARLGGQLWTAREDGFVVELGAEGFIARSEAVPRLASELGLGAALLDQRATLSYRLDAGTLHPLAPGEASDALDFQVARADRGAGIRSFTGGVESLAEALAAAIDGRVTQYLGVAAEAVEPDGPRVRVDGVAYDAAVLTVPNAIASVARSTVSNVNVSLAFAREEVAHALDGTGFVIPGAETGFRACTFVSSKFSRRAPAGHVLLRAFFRPTADELEDDDIDWTRRATRALGDVLGIEAPPRRSWIAVWPDALPVYDDAYRARVATTDAALAARRVYLAGAAYHGSGIDAAVRSAERLAAKLTARA